MRFRSAPPRALRGATLLELIVTAAIVAILLTSALPSVSGLISGLRLGGAVDEMNIALALARGEAIAGSSRAAVAARNGDWRQGWFVFRDDNDNGVLDAAEAVVREFPAPASGTTIRARFGNGATPVFSFSHDGFARRPGGNGLLLGSIVMENGRGVRTLCFGATRVRVVAATACS